jgi:hypothetical protein
MTPQEKNELTENAKRLIFSDNIESIKLGLYLAKENNLDVFCEKWKNLFKVLNKSYLEIYKKELNISCSTITELPDNLTVEKLNLRWSNIKQLPKNLKCFDYLRISGTEIKTIPKCIEAGFLVANNCKIESLDYDYNIKGFSFVSSKLRYIKNNFTALSYLDLRSTKLKELPNGLKVGGDLNIRGTEINYLPPDVKCNGTIFFNAKMLNTKSFNDYIENFQAYKTTI